ncbi:MAG: hypothetical protein KDK33_17290 [Leptospiraceae bacterium]|nr:hypothetical protein [Leptospiraceae bacterium]
MPSTPLYLSLGFLALTLSVAIGLFWIFQKAWQNHRTIVAVVFGAMFIVFFLQCFAATQGFWLQRVRGDLPFTGVAPVVGPVFALGWIVFFLFRKGPEYQSLSITWLIGFQGFRLLIETFLFHGLYSAKLIPLEMTILGRNPDLLIGLSAPIVAFLWHKKKLGPMVTALWNLLGLITLINIVATAILSLPTSFQVFGHDQPNIGALMFPFVLLPAFLVPAAFFGHIYALDLLWNRNRSGKVD